jgi:hypothetical protein
MAVLWFTDLLFRHQARTRVLLGEHRGNGTVVDIERGVRLIEAPSARVRGVNAAYFIAFARTRV